MQWRYKSIAMTLMMTIFVSSSYAGTVEIPEETLIDKIRGGLLGQMLGNLNGLEHENKYIDEPGDVQNYVPSLPDGARTDDDTDLEWVYIYLMENENTIFLSPDRIAELWKKSINRRIWCSNQYVRQIIDLGILPPLTGMVVFNPWAEFNISGQFICETFGLISPCMPQTAAKIGLNYTRVTIDAEPAQTTQLFTTMIATAFSEYDIDRILDAGLACLDPNSVIAEIIKSEREWHRLYPNDWRKTRQLTREKYARFAGEMRDRNGYELNTASVIAALLYGNGDFTGTLQTAFNFGWDADCNAATAGTVIGVIKGYRWMLSQGWSIVDRYKNTTRKNMPEDETITSFADRLINLAEKTITENGGQRAVKNGKVFFRIETEEPGTVYRLRNPGEQIAGLLETMHSDLERILLQSDASDTARARAAYCAIFLNVADKFRQKHPAEWTRAIEKLQNFSNVSQALFYHSDVPEGVDMRDKATAAGWRKPEKRENLWE